MTATIQPLPTDAIDEGAMTRDRTGFEPEPYEELKRSVLANGIRMPVEVYDLPTPYREKRYGLISGCRRLAVVRELHALTGQARWATIPAIVREPDGIAGALAAMVEENEIRAEISPYERGRIALIAREQGVFGTIEEAVEALYPAASQPKRSRLRALARLAEALDRVFAAPERLSQCQALRLANAVRDGYGAVMTTALETTALRDFETQWALMLPILREAEETGPAEPEPTWPGRPRRVLALRRGITIRRERVREGWLLRFTGREATGMLMDTVLDEIERMFSPG